MIIWIIHNTCPVIFFVCFPNHINLGHLERIGSELVHNKSSKESSQLQNGYFHELDEKSTYLPGSVVDPHQQLLIVLSNIGYCKDELSYELYNKYKHIWLQSRYIVNFLLFLFWRIDIYIVLMQFIFPFSLYHFTSFSLSLYQKKNFAASFLSLAS